MAYLSNMHKIHLFIVVWKRSKLGKLSIKQNLKETSNLYLKKYN